MTIRVYLRSGATPPTGLMVNGDERFNRPFILLESLQDLAGRRITTKVTHSVTLRDTIDDQRAFVELGKYEEDGVQAAVIDHRSGQTNLPWQEIRMEGPSLGKVKKVYDLLRSHQLTPRESWRRPVKA
jgi:hypothetical protein